MSPRQQRCAVAAAIIGAHALGVLLALRLLVAPGTAEPEEVLTYIVASVPERSNAAVPEKALATQSRPQLVPQPAAPLPTGAISVAPPSGHGSADWGAEAGRAAAGVVDDLARSESRKCDDSPKPGSWLPKCHKRPPHFEWNEEPRQAGFKNGLPYVRLGKHCILVMGLLGCQVGEEPPANGHLFDDMNDPDRDRSSVPDIADVNEPASAAPQRPSVLREHSAQHH